MNGSQTQVNPMHRYLPETIASGSVTEGIGAIGVVILAILGLAGVFTNIVASVGTIVAGAVFWADSMLARSAAHTLHLEGAPSGIGAGASAGFFGGLAAIILGILSFFQMTPEHLVSVAVLVLGAAMFLSGGTLARLNVLLVQPQGAAGAGWTIGSGSAFMGLAVTVLGILAVIGLVPMTLALVGLLCLGAGALFSGAPGEAVQT